MTDVGHTVSSESRMSNNFQTADRNRHAHTSCVWEAHLHFCQHPTNSGILCGKFPSVFQWAPAHTSSLARPVCFHEGKPGLSAVPPADGPLPAGIHSSECLDSFLKNCYVNNGKFNSQTCFNKLRKKGRSPLILGEHQPYLSGHWCAPFSLQYISTSSSF